MNEHRSWLRRCITRCRHFSLATILFAAIASPVGAQTTNFTEIYNSGVLALGADETLQLTIVNNNNVTDPALPALTTSEEACAYVAQFLDGNGNVLQKQQQTLQPGQNVSFSINGPQTVQARVDISPGTSSGFAALIADQCAVSDEIRNTASSDPVLLPPLSGTRVNGDKFHCIGGCPLDCNLKCRGVQPLGSCTRQCIEACGGMCF